MKDQSQIPAVAEPWFLASNAKVFFRPVMTPQDFAKAIQHSPKPPGNLESSRVSVVGDFESRAEKG
jgi:hypothetical protein